MAKTRTGATRVAFWQRDLIASCKTGEFIEPSPKSDQWRERWRVLRWIPLAGVVLIVLKFWLKSERASIDVLMHADRVAGLHRTAQFFSWCFGGLAIASVFGCAWLVLLALRALRGGRWPPANARVQRSTPVIAGWCLWLSCGIPLLLAPVLVFVVSNSAVQLIAMAWNTYADAHAGVVAPAVGSAHAKPVARNAKP